MVLQSIQIRNNLQLLVFCEATQILGTSRVCFSWTNIMIQLYGSIWMDIIHRAPRATIWCTPTAQLWITSPLFPMIPYESHRYSKFNLNSLPLLYTRYRHLGYLLSQNLLTNRAMQSKLLSKISSDASDSLPSTVIVVSFWTRGNSTILNQLDTGSIMVRAMKSMTEPSLPLRVYGPTRSTHSVLHGVVITVVGSRCPYLSFCFLLTWHVLHDFVIDRMVVLIPFQYIVTCVVSSRRMCPGCCR